MPPYNFYKGEKEQFWAIFLNLIQELPEVKERLLEIQSAFMSLLGDSNDLIQVRNIQGATSGCSPY